MDIPYVLKNAEITFSGTGTEELLNGYTRPIGETYNCWIGKIDELYKVKREIVSAIWQVKDNTLRKLLFARYIQSKTWEQIAEIINKQDVKWVRTAIHSRALKEIEKIISKRDSM